MAFPNKKGFKDSKAYKFYTKYLRFRSSIFSRVIYIITVLSIILFLSFGLIFKSVYEQYMNTNDPAEWQQYRIDGGRCFISFDANQ